MPIHDVLTTSQWGLALAIFALRIVDVSIGTVRTLAVVQGRIKASVILGFFEVFVWLVAVSQVLGQVTTNPMLMLVYCAGFAGGNAIGIFIEKKLALGGVVLRVISAADRNAMTRRLCEQAVRVTAFDGWDRETPVTLFYVVCRRRILPALLGRARELDPELFFAAEPLRESSLELTRSIRRATGWRSSPAPTLCTLPSPWRSGVHRDEWTPTPSATNSISPSFAMRSFSSSGVTSLGDVKASRARGQPGITRSSSRTISFSP